MIDCFLAYTPTSQELLSAALPVGSLLGFNADKVRVHYNTELAKCSNYVYLGTFYLLNYEAKC